MFCLLTCKSFPCLVDKNAGKGEGVILLPKNGKKIFEWISRNETTFMIQISIWKDNVKYCGQCVSWNQCPKVRNCGFNNFTPTIFLVLQIKNLWYTFIPPHVEGCFFVSLNIIANSWACICNNIWIETKVFLCLWHVRKTIWVENIVK
jgi:hypothetical protein